MTTTDPWMEALRALWRRGWQVRLDGHTWAATCQADGYGIMADQMGDLADACDAHDRGAHLPQPLTAS